MRAGLLAVAAVIVLSGCGSSKYAGLSRSEARHAALNAITGQRKVNPQPIDEQKGTNSIGGDAWIVEFKSGYADGYQKWCVWVWRRPGDQIGSDFSGC